MNWRYPLTNLGQKREREKTYSPPVPTATVRDADGNVILFFAGEPHRRNKDAVKNATQFCEEMNQMHRCTGCGDIAYIRDALGEEIHEEVKIAESEAASAIHRGKELSADGK